MDFQLALTADDRVHRTGDGLVFKEGALQASFVAADAGADVLGTALHRFSGPFGIGLQGRPSTTKSPLPLWMMSSAYSGSVMEPEAMMGHVDAADAALGYRAVHIVHAGGLRRFAHAVFQLRIADFGRCKQVGKQI